VKINPDDLIRQATAAKMRGVSAQAINRLIQRGSLNTVVIDGLVFVYKSEVENFKPSVGGRPKSGKRKRRPRQ